MSDQLLPSGRPLGSLRRGDHGRVLAVDGRLAPGSAVTADELERRLLEMGIVEGATIEVLHEGPIGRDPIAVRVNCSTIALRRCEANAVRVSDSGQAHAAPLR